MYTFIDCGNDLNTFQKESYIILFQLFEEEAHSHYLDQELEHARAQTAHLRHCAQTALSAAEAYEFKMAAAQETWMGWAAQGESPPPALLSDNLARMQTVI